MPNKIEFKDLFTYSFSLDCIVFGYRDGQIQVLLIKRAMEPFLGEWAIPGDLVYPNEDLPEAAQRILFELTNIRGVEMHQGSTFGNPKRHPQGRVITNVFFALVRIDDVDAEAHSWAEELKWTPIHEVPKMAFDHNEILETTYEQLVQKLRHQPICFDLLPEKFTLNEFQQLYEYAFEKELDKANFRKKIKPLPIQRLSEKQKNVKHRPAALYSFNQLTYKELEKEDLITFRM